VDISDPENPIILGKLPTHTSSSSWRDIKTYQDYAFIVSEASGHGMQVFDLTELLSAPTDEFTTFAETAHYDDFGNAHNIFINDETAYAYSVGTSTCGGGGLHMIDISTPSSPSFAGCYGARGYTHDVQCVLYDGPDSGYTNREICFASNEDKMDIIDVTNKGNPSLVSSFTYSGYGYTHQGWLTEDKHYFLIDDEVDELSGGGATKTVICDVSNLENPIFTGAHFGETNAIDHNQYVLGKYTFQANYRSGLRILELDDIANGNLVEIAYFDTYPGSNSNAFSGAWSNYPYFQSGVVIISDINRGLFVVRPTSLQFAPTTSPAPTPVSSSIPSGTPTLSDVPSSAPTECEGDFFNVDVLTDAYPEETSWILTNICGDGSTVFERPPGYFTAEGTLYADIFCSAVSAQYQFTISDSFGDGICCEYGQGEYTVVKNGVEVASGGNFDDEDSTIFGSCGPTPAPSSGPPTASPTECTGDIVNIDILTDNYPSETSYTLQETCDGSTVFQRPQGYFTSTGTLYEDTICTPNSLEYLFTIFDSFGDGICCGYGQGEYTVTLNGSEVGTGGEFGSSDTATFGSCEQETPVPSPGPPTSSPTPECEESPLGVPFGGSDYFCEDFPSSICNRDEAKSHCPVTCDACAEYACEDSMLNWVFQGNNASCAALAGAPPNFINTACQIEEIAQTCRSTCGSCD